MPNTKALNINTSLTKSLTLQECAEYIAYAVRALDLPLDFRGDIEVNLPEDLTAEVITHPRAQLRRVQ